MGERDLSPRHEEFIAGTELAVGESPLLLLPERVGGFLWVQSLSVSP